MNCGRRPHEVPILRTESLSPDIGICIRCDIKLRAQGFTPVDVQAEGDRHLASSEYRNFLARQRTPPKCRHCGEPVLVTPQGGEYLWCQECELERQQVERGVYGVSR